MTRCTYQIALGSLLLFSCPALLWAQLPVTDGLSLWLDATDASTLFRDEDLSMPAQPGDVVVGWQDKSGNDYHATAIFDGPSFEAEAVNGQDALLFAGGEFGASMLVSDQLEVVRPYSIFLVNQLVTRGRTLQSATANWLLGGWSASIANFAGGFTGSVPSELDFAYVVDTTGTPDGESTFFVNNLDATSDPSPNGSPGQLGVGAVGQFAGEAANALVSEVLVYDRVLATDDLASVRDYLYTKYNIDRDFNPNLGAPLNTALAGTLGTFTGGDEDEGLDFTGDFAYAVNVGGFEATVGDAEFTDGSIVGMEDGNSPGVNIVNPTTELPSWIAPTLGESENDLELTNVMASIRYGGDFTVELDVDSGQGYKLQLLFAESCCDRGFDITVEDVLVVDNMSIPELQGGSNNQEAGAYYSYELTAQDDLLTIHLGGINPRTADNLPILNGFTLERVDLTLPGDYNEDGVLDAVDIDLQSAEMKKDPVDQDLAKFDHNNDGVITVGTPDAPGDRLIWVKDLRMTSVGDSNFDDVFDSGDLVLVFGEGKYDADDMANWAQGDWSGDMVFDSGDLVLAFQDGGYVAGAAAAVPEPASSLIVLTAMMGLAIRRRFAAV